MSVVLEVWRVAGLMALCAVGLLAIFALTGLAWRFVLSRAFDFMGDDP